MNRNQSDGLAFPENTFFSGSVKNPVAHARWSDFASDTMVARALDASRAPAEAFAAVSGSPIVCFSSRIFGIANCVTVFLSSTGNALVGDDAMPPRNLLRGRPASETRETTLVVFVFASYRSASVGRQRDMLKSDRTNSLEMRLRTGSATL